MRDLEIEMIVGIGDSMPVEQKPAQPRTLLVDDPLFKFTAPSPRDDADAQHSMDENFGADALGFDSPGEFRKATNRDAPLDFRKAEAADASRPNAKLEKLEKSFDALVRTEMASALATFRPKKIVEMKKFELMKGYPARMDRIAKMLAPLALKFKNPADHFEEIAELANDCDDFIVGVIAEA